jgi:hypothetical protein
VPERRDLPFRFSERTSDDGLSSETLASNAGFTSEAERFEQLGDAARDREDLLSALIFYRGAMELHPGSAHLMAKISKTAAARTRGRGRLRSNSHEPRRRPAYVASTMAAVGVGIVAMAMSWPRDRGDTFVEAASTIPVAAASSTLALPSAAGTTGDLVAPGPPHVANAIAGAQDRRALADKRNSDTPPVALNRSRAKRARGRVAASTASQSRRNDAKCIQGSGQPCARELAASQRIESPMGLLQLFFR